MKRVKPSPVACRDMAQTFRERMAVPDSKTDDQEIWGIMRTWLVLLRWIIFIATILIAEFLEEYFMLGLSVSIWAVAIGIPIFLIVSFFIYQGDKRLNVEKKPNKQTSNDLVVLKRPIGKRQ